MKARIKKTGEIINIANYAKVTLDQCDNWGNPIELGFDEVEILQEPTSGIDWEQRRYEIANNCINGILGNDEMVDLANDAGLKRNCRDIPTNVAKMAVAFADALIAELKKGCDQ